MGTNAETPGMITENPFINLLSSSLLVSQFNLLELGGAYMP
jgi:hypothetical protein